MGDHLPWGVARPRSRGHGHIQRASPCTNKRAPDWTVDPSVAAGTDSSQLRRYRIGAVASSDGRVGGAVESGIT